jgi:hypothetical protein
MLAEKEARLDFFPNDKYFGGITAIAHKHHQR